MIAELYLTNPLFHSIPIYTIYNNNKKIYIKENLSSIFFLYASNNITSFFFCWQCFAYLCLKVKEEENLFRGMSDELRYGSSNMVLVFAEL